MRYIVMCYVSGGVTGTREAPLRKDGSIMYFDSFQDAEHEAQRCRFLKSSSSKSLPTFRYTPQEVKDEMPKV